MEEKALHWADQTAEKIIRQKGDKQIYTCASGVTPSGTVHIGNFRELISVDLVVRALKRKGKQVRFLFSWDDYDVFRKVPANMPNQEELAKYLRYPITLIPDPYREQESYARHHETEVEKVLPVTGIHPEYLYQAQRYRSSLYWQQIQQALKCTQEIRVILDEHRTEKLDADWLPISVFCDQCNKDTTEKVQWNNDSRVSYLCSSCGNQGSVDLQTTKAVKLFWRIDWPMRWAYEKVDFEPAGKDHHSEGGSFDTAKIIAQKIFQFEPPVTFQYDFIGIKGRGGKISSSSGDVISLSDVLEIYQPEVVRYLFASTRPNTEFVISFDLDVLKIYEDYDKCERIYFGKENLKDEDKLGKEKRIYELSQVSEIPVEMPIQITFRHLCNLLQIHDGNSDAALAPWRDASSQQLSKLQIRAKCAWNWICNFAPENFLFRLCMDLQPNILLSDQEKSLIREVFLEIKNNFHLHTEQSLSEWLYKKANELNIDIKVLFSIFYRILIGKEQGPRLSGFILAAGKDKVERILKNYVDKNETENSKN